MPVKVLNEVGEGTFFDVAQGIEFATDFQSDGKNPVKVINMSLGGAGPFRVGEPRDRQGLRARGRRWWRRPATTARVRSPFPASSSKVIAVGGVDGRKQRAPYSNFGRELSVVAPGRQLRPGRRRGRRARSACSSRCPTRTRWTWGATTGSATAASTARAWRPRTSPPSPRSSSRRESPIPRPCARRSSRTPSPGRGRGRGRNDTFGHGLVRPEAALSGLGLNDGPKR